MQNNLVLKIRQNGKKRICLYVSGSTPVVIEPLVKLRGTSSFIRDNFGAIKGKRTSYYVGKDTDSKHNNNQLNNLLEKLEEIVSVNPELTTPKQIVDFYSGKDIKPKQEEKPKTLDMFFQECIDFIRYTENSSNYKNYVTAKNSIAKVYPELSKKILKDISKGDVVKLQECLLTKAPTAFMKTMKIFQATINKAIEKELNNNSFKWNWKENAPKHETNHHQYIENDKLYQIFNIDLKEICGKMQIGKCEMYLDIIKLMYNTQSRPVDTMQFNINDIKEIEGVMYWIYTPVKKSIKANKGKKTNEAMSPLNNEAMAIIEKYKHNADTLNGYIFPITTNKRVYKDNIQKCNVRNRILYNVNELLKKIGEFVGVDNLTVYDFRHARLTNLVSSKEIPNWAIAKAAGTSIKMLDKHYVDKNKIVQNYANYF